MEQQLQQGRMKQIGFLDSYGFMYHGEPRTYAEGQVYWMHSGEATQWLDKFPLAVVDMTPRPVASAVAQCLKTISKRR